MKTAKKEHSNDNHYFSDYWLPMPNYNTLCGARDMLGMRGSVGRGGGGQGVRTILENYKLYE